MILPVKLKLYLSRKGSEQVLLAKRDYHEKSSCSIGVGQQMSGILSLRNLGIKSNTPLRNLLRPASYPLSRLADLPPLLFPTRSSASSTKLAVAPPTRPRRLLLPDA